MFGSPLTDVTVDCGGSDTVEDRAAHAEVAVRDGGFLLRAASDEHCQLGIDVQAHCVRRADLDFGDDAERA